MDKEVTTPVGKMNVAGALRSNGAILFDLLIASMYAAIVNEILKRAGFGNIYISSILFVMTCIYTYLAHQEVLPGIARWALGMHRFKYSEIAEYRGKGTLIVYEPLDTKTYTLRTVVAVITFIIPYAVLRYLI